MRELFLLNQLKKQTNLHMLSRLLDRYTIVIQFFIGLEEAGDEGAGVKNERKKKWLTITTAVMNGHFLATIGKSVL